MEGSHILVADDAIDILKLLNELLKHHGYRVTLAKDAMEALDKILKLRNRKHPVDLLLTDVKLGEIDGFELMDRLRQKGVLIPVIIMTGYRNHQTIDNLESRGHKEYLSKPFSSKELLGMIESALTKSGDNG